MDALNVDDTMSVSLVILSVYRYKLAPLFIGQTYLR